MASSPKVNASIGVLHNTQRSSRSFATRAWGFAQTGKQHKLLRVRREVKRFFHETTRSQGIPSNLSQRAGMCVSRDAWFEVSRHVRLRKNY
ncbi:hypothetical protein T440DRAFT_465547 [Plenodomus tracheiphilus IPT5]|uniref:Uncharacterized protein n=1 Tax=Plenodomus tracheiphilus IPT5 TaxID=1408161 RepID=A0A6A7BGG0_9PLEO|nr:hypothetical protein T440DRAFT_465547 [Plenodomus tracheiphilus IPT5]